MWKICVNRKIMTNLVFICAILINIILINTELINGDNSLETNLPDLKSDEDATIISHDTSNITSTLIEEEIQSTINAPKSTTQITENQDQSSTTQISENQDQIVNNQQNTTVNILEETSNTIEYNIKHEISNPPFIPSVEARIIPVNVVTDPQLIITDARLVPPDMDDFTVNVQKCCPKGEIMLLGEPGEKSTCIESDIPFDLPVFYANSTHYWNYTTTLVDNINIVSRDPCEDSKYHLDPYDESDTFRVLFNSSLYMPFNLDMLNNDQYCLDTIQRSETFFKTAIICTTSPKTDLYLYLYLAGICISIFCLVILSIYSAQRKDMKEDHKKCLAFFAGTMALAYLFIFICKFRSYYNNTIYSILSYLIYYLKLKYCLWLNMLSFDTSRCVRDSSADSFSYMKLYLIATFTIPIAFVLLTFFDGFMPALPDFYVDDEYPSPISIILLYIVPVFISTLGNLILMCTISLPKERYNNVKDLVATLRSKDWKTPPRNIREIKQMYRQCFVLFGIVFFFFLLEIVCYFVRNLNFTGRYIFLVQGMFVSLIFIRKFRKKSTSPIATDMELESITNNGTANV